MKIWQRIFLMTLFIVTMCTLAIGVMLMQNQIKIQIAPEVQNSKNLHEELHTLINSRIEVSKEIQDSKVVNDSQYQQIVNAIVKQENGNEHGIKIVIDDEYSITNGEFPLGITDNYVITSEYEAKYEIIKLRENYYFVMCSDKTIAGRSVRILSEVDITEIYEMFDAQIAQLQNMNILLSLIAAGILLILIKWLLNPINELKDGIHDIADGNYGRTLETKGNTEITQLIYDVNQMSEKIEKNVGEMEEMLENRRIFIGNMAHEMKTPLTAILGFADILTIKPDMTGEQVREYSEYIYKEALRLKSMSGKLMELMQIKENNVKKEILSLKTILQEVISTEKIIFGKENIEVKYSLCDALVLADDDLLKSLFYNIMDNAKKATKPGGQILVVMTKTDSTVSAAIKDYGIGIPKEELKKITEPFYMVDKSRTRENGGAGLGLALCERIVTLSDGVMEFESEEGKGTNVIITFPLAEKGDENDEKQV